MIRSFIKPSWNSGRNFKHMGHTGTKDLVMPENRLNNLSRSQVFKSLSINGLGLIDRSTTVSSQILRGYNC